MCRLLSFGHEAGTRCSSSISIHERTHREQKVTRKVFFPPRSSLRRAIPNSRRSDRRRGAELSVRWSPNLSRPQRPFIIAEINRLARIEGTPNQLRSFLSPRYETYLFHPSRTRSSLPMRCGGDVYVSTLFRHPLASTRSVADCLDGTGTGRGGRIREQGCLLVAPTSWALRCGSRSRDRVPLASAPGHPVPPLPLPDTFPWPQRKSQRS